MSVGTHCHCYHPRNKGKYPGDTLQFIFDSCGDWESKGVELAPDGDSIKGFKTEDIDK